MPPPRIRAAPDPLLKSIELAGPVERIRSTFVNGINRMPVRVQLA